MIEETVETRPCLRVESNAQLTALVSQNEGMRDNDGTT
jgi:hypothetical protein